NMSHDTYPLVMKIGHAHGGLGKIRLARPDELQDLSGVVAVANTYATTETLVDSKFDIHIQKIGNNYKAFLRRSISGGWKANVSSSMLEQLPMTDRFRSWIDEVAQLFGGMDICSVEAVQNKEGAVLIVEANGSDAPLLGDSQEEDRRLISELVLGRMHHACSAAAARLSRAGSLGQGINRYSATPNGPTQPQPPPPPMPQQQQQQQAAAAGAAAASMIKQPMPPPQSAPSVGAAASAGPPPPSSGPPPPRSGGPPPPPPPQQPPGGGPPGGAARPPPPPRQTSLPRGPGGGPGGGGEEGEDTMKNLRKTFAGIFGDM
uniref:Synapsin_C domain-containing protein n=1 Tax=Macrostomum lignano TaxID=282301 RepID=A0A1I8IWG4_9PLAT